VVEGPAHLLSRRFAIRDDEVSIGRGDTCYVAIDDPRISRIHAQVVREGDGLVLLHRSQTNQTFLNGKSVPQRAALTDGDEIQLADCVVLRLEAPAVRADARPGARFGLREAMEERVALEDRIASEFVRDGSFLDVDVVDSYRMKVGEDRPERVVVSFERFRAYVEGSVEQHGGQVLNSNGDEVMAFFPSADAAVAGARSIVALLPDWNVRENRLDQEFRVRVGIHTGRSAVDLERGVAYSPVLDGAGHLQKAAPVNGILISRATFDSLGRREGLESRGVATHGGIEAYRVSVAGE
jgi:class 3 adenylate cyclase